MKNGDTVYIENIGKLNLCLQMFSTFTGYVKELNPEDGSFVIDYKEYYGRLGLGYPRTNLKITKELVGQNYIFLTVNSQDSVGHQPYSYKHIFDKSNLAKSKSILLRIKEWL